MLTQSVAVTVLSQLLKAPSPPFPVPAGDKAVPAPPGTPVPDKHLPGGRHPNVVPVVRAEGLHRGHLELRLLPGHVLRPAQFIRTAR